jgi:glycosyltransferase involved in cell wall biosynthesis
MKQNGRYLFVSPRYGREILGGAETLLRGLAVALRERGATVEVFSTCARDNRTWEDSFSAGETMEDGIRVHRFPVSRRNLEAWIPLQIRLSDGMPLTLDEQFTWMAESVNSFPMYAEIARRSREFDAMFFGPYLFGTTFWGSLIDPARSVLIPCLHDECYAYVDIIQSMFHQVRGALFNALPERDLARGLYGGIRGDEVGMGFEIPSHPRERELPPYFKEEFPYLLYLGRKETGKNAHVLIDYFLNLKAQGKYPNLKLAIVGGGSFSDLGRPKALERDDVLDIIHVTEEEKRALLRHSTALVQPSTNESFSIVLMEAWLEGVPVLVHGKCHVTRHHVIESGGGLYFSSREDFGAVVGTLVEDPKLARDLAESGYRYVSKRYTWDATCERFYRVMGELFDEQSGATSIE